MKEPKLRIRDRFGGTLWVELPYALKDDFRQVFPTARWNADAKLWYMDDSDATAAAVAAWIESKQPLMPGIIARENERQAELEAGAAAARRIEESRIEAERLANARRAVAEAEMRDRITPIIDTHAVDAAFLVMWREAGVPSAKARHRRNEARAIFEGAYETLRDHGFEAPGMAAVLNVNLNRSDAKADLRHASWLRDIRRVME